MDAEGVEYFEIQAGGQSIRLFRCGVYRCDLTPGSCAGRFNAAQNLTDQAGVGHPGYSCKRCPIGAAHADAKGFKPKRKAECIRCGEWSYKLIRGLICVSCFNRQQEVLKGQDRRGRPPKTVIRFWGTGPAREPGKVPQVFVFRVEIDGLGIREFVACSPKEALLQATRLHYRGQPLAMRITNAADLGRAVPYLRHPSNAPTPQAA